MNDLVSIIMPAYNEEDLILETIDSVVNQTYQHWELIIVDDFSTDNTGELVKNAALKDTRIKYFKLESNKGAAQARNYAVEKSRGKFLAFLDSDDIWKKEKLEKQIKFMIDNNYSFTCTYYNKIDFNGKDLDTVVTSERVIDYESLLKNNVGNSTVIYNSEKLGKTIIPDIRKRNDYVMWLQTIKKSKHIFCLEEVLSSHRIVENSLSSNKFDLVKYHWRVYREIENLNVFKSIYLILYYGYKTIFGKR